MLNYQTLRHQCFEGFLESNGFPQDDDPHQRSLVVWDPPQKKIPSRPFSFQVKKQTMMAEETRGHLVAVFGVIETFCFEDVFFRRKKCGVLLVVILGEGSLIFSDRNIG